MKVSEYYEVIQGGHFPLDDCPDCQAHTLVAHHVITSYLNHHGANFKVVNQKRGVGFEVLCRQICIDKTTYTFIPHNHLERGLRPDLYIGLVLFADNQKPVKYLFPSTVWLTPNLLFTNTAVKHNEYGISVNKKTIAELAEYAFEEQIAIIR